MAQKKIQLKYENVSSPGTYDDLFPVTKEELVMDEEGKTMSQKFSEQKQQIDGVIAQLADIATLANTINTSKDVKYVAHRGLSAIAPENTIPAYELAGKAGFWGAETDIMPTSDGQWVLMHDDTVDRTTNGTGTVASMTLDQIRALVIDGGNNVTRHPNLKVPTLDEFFVVCKKWGMTPLIEIKRTNNLGDYDTLVQQIKKHGYEESCIVLAPFFTTAQEIRYRSSKIIIHLLGDITETNIDRVKSLKNASLDTYAPTLTKEKVELAHSNGVLVNCWTVDDHQRAKTLIGYGVDFITTNIIAEVI